MKAVAGAGDTCSSNMKKYHFYLSFNNSSTVFEPVCNKLCRKIDVAVHVMNMEKLGYHDNSLATILETGITCQNKNNDKHRYEKQTDFAANCCISMTAHVLVFSVGIRDKPLFPGTKTEPSTLSKL